MRARVLLCTQSDVVCQERDLHVYSRVHKGHVGF